MTTEGKFVTELSGKILPDATRDQTRNLRVRVHYATVLTRVSLSRKVQGID